MPLDFVQLSSSSSSSSSGTSVKSKLLLGLLCYADDSLPFYCSIALLVEQCSLPSDLSSRNSIKEIPVVHEGLACGLDAILLCIITYAQ